MENNFSTLLPMTGAENVRDLGGIRTKNGAVIISGKLIRADGLQNLTKADIACLKEAGLKTIFDFRGLVEQEDKPDPEIDGVENISLPILEEQRAGISRDQKSDMEAMRKSFSRFATTPDIGRIMMRDNYVSMIRSDHSVKAYSLFMRHIAKALSGATLWHCSAGKDRTGFAAAIIEEILGVARDDIFADYLLTNKYLNLQKQIDAIAKQFGVPALPQEAIDSITDFMIAREEYLLAAYNAAEETYGSIEGYIEKALGVDAAMQDTIRGLYLA